MGACGCYLGFGKSAEVGGEVVLDARHGAGQGDPADEQDEEHHVREERREPHHLKHPPSNYR